MHFTTPITEDTSSVWPLDVLHSGPPFLRSTYGWGHVLCHACQPEVLESSIADAIAAHRAEVWVQWSDARGDVAARPVDAGDACEEFVLSVRLLGESVASCSGRRGQSLRLLLDTRHAPLWSTSWRDAHPAHELGPPH